jgi:hypothetical protein
VHLVEVVLAVGVVNRTDGDPRGIQRNEELTQTGMPVCHVLGANQGQHQVSAVSMRSPDLRAGKPPARPCPVRRGADAREIRAGVGLGHADAGEKLTLRHCRQIALALLLGAEGKDLRASLAIGEPVRGDGRACGEQFLQNDVPLDRGTATAAVVRRLGHPDPAAATEFGAEAGGEAGHPAAGQ